NRTGMDGEQMYKGGSEIVDNRGHVLAKASDFEEEVEVVDIDLSLADDKNWNGINDLMKDRREELY
ncbi:MAG TPA: nitrilase-related carbon-nitrogen hydrolase, partial [Candidatus Paceibacterota bacterium]